jgi:hypothetical protein
MKNVTFRQIFKWLLRAIYIAIIVFVLLPIAYIYLFQKPATSDKYEFTLYEDGLSEIVGIAHTGDDRLFILERPGLIRVIEDGTLLETPFLDLQEQVQSEVHVEQGFLGLAFDPDYAENGYLYVNYTSQPDGNMRLERYQVSEDDPNLGDPDSGTLVIAYAQPFPVHNGGPLRFGPDGYLYVAVGDGGLDSPHNAQLIDRLLGSLLRIDVHGEPPYEIPEDNPLVDNPDARGEIWAYGLRNPWGFSFDRETGDLYIADVGQDTYEEVNFQPADSPGGQNYGWSIYEGYDIYNPPGANNPDVPESEITFPVTGYPHNLLNVSERITEGYNCSVIGGYVYRGDALPDLQGYYVYGDWCSGLIWTLRQESDGWNNEKLLDTDFSITSFGEDAAGEIYLSTFQGEIWKLVAK